METDDVRVINIENADQSLALEKAQVDQQVATAKQYPRSIAKFRQRVQDMATINEAVAESCTYALKRAGKTITGPSVRFAEIVAASYGNIISGARVVNNDGKTITAQGLCWDLENNTKFVVEVKRRITQKDGSTFSEDMQVVAGNAACAIAFRNAVFKVVPAAITEDIYDDVVKVGKGTSATLTARRDKAIGWFEANGVSLEKVLRKLEIKGVEDITLEKLSLLSGFRSAIKNQESSIDEIFASDSSEGNANINPEEARLRAMIVNAKTLDAALSLAGGIPVNLKEMFGKILNEVYPAESQDKAAKVTSKTRAAAAKETPAEPTNEMAAPSAKNEYESFCDMVRETDLATMGDYNSVSALKEKADTEEKAQFLNRFLDEMLGR